MNHIKYSRGSKPGTSASIYGQCPDQMDPFDSWNLITSSGPSRRSIDLIRVYDGTSFSSTVEYLVKDIEICNVTLTALWRKGLKEFASDERSRGTRSRRQQRDTSRSRSFGPLCIARTTLTGPSRRHLGAIWKIGDSLRSFRRRVLQSETTATTSHRGFHPFLTVGIFRTSRVKDLAGTHLFAFSGSYCAIFN